jgi:hypothetical protein
MYGEMKVMCNMPSFDPGIIEKFEPWSDCGGDPNCDNPDCIRRCILQKKAECLKEQLLKPFDEAAEKERIFKEEQKRIRREESKKGWIR